MKPCGDCTACRTSGKAACERQPRPMKVLKGGDGKPRPCPAPFCHHQGQGSRYVGEDQPRTRHHRMVRPGQRHKKYPGGPWCDGKRDVVHDHAIELFNRANEALSSAVLAHDWHKVLCLAGAVIDALAKWRRP